MEGGGGGGEGDVHEQFQEVLYLYVVEICKAFCMQYIILKCASPYSTVIEEANWLTLLDDIAEIFGEGFDAVICLGNSFSHMPDTSGDRQNQRYFLIFTLDYVVTCLITL